MSLATLSNLYLLLALNLIKLCRLDTYGENKQMKCEEKKLTKKYFFKNK